eukprot:Gb_38724 [translate_table: standard]
MFYQGLSWKEVHSVFLSLIAHPDSPKREKRTKIDLVPILSGGSLSPGVHQYFDEPSLEALRNPGRSFINQDAIDPKEGTTLSLEHFSLTWEIKGKSIKPRKVKHKLMKSLKTCTQIRVCVNQRTFELSVIEHLRDVESPSKNYGDTVILGDRSSGRQSGLIQLGMEQFTAKDTVDQLRLQYLDLIHSGITDYARAPVLYLPYPIVVEMLRHFENDSFWFQDKVVQVNEELIPHITGLPRFGNKIDLKEEVKSRATLEEGYYELLGIMDSKQRKNKEAIMLQQREEDPASSNPTMALADERLENLGDTSLGEGNQVPEPVVEAKTQRASGEPEAPLPFTASENILGHPTEQPKRRYPGSPSREFKTEETLAAPRESPPDETNDVECFEIAPSSTQPTSNTLPATPRRKRTKRKTPLSLGGPTRMLRK